MPRLFGRREVGIVLSKGGVYWEPKVKLREQRLALPGPTQKVGGLLRDRQGGYDLLSLHGCPGGHHRPRPGRAGGHRDHPRIRQPRSGSRVPLRARSTPR